MIYAKATAFLVGRVVLAVILLRVIVGPLWGSGTDLGLVAAPLAFGAGVLGLGKLAMVIARPPRDDRFKQGKAKPWLTASRRPGPTRRNPK